MNRAILSSGDQKQHLKEKSFQDPTKPSDWRQAAYKLSLLRAHNIDFAIIRSRVVMLLTMSLLFLTSCSRVDSSRNWNPKTDRLDKLVASDPSLVDFARDVKDFYVGLRKKDWALTYARRWKTFRQDCPEGVYLKTARAEGQDWGLLDYEILSVDRHDSDEVVLICKFIELPDSAVSYGTVRWHNEDGIWRCDCAGPERLSIFRYMRE
jgi:hypothetical protein